VNRLRVVLILVTLSIFFLPLAGALVLYRNDLLGLVVPGNLVNLSNSSNPLNISGVSPVGTFVPPQYVNSTYDNASRTFSLTFSYTNPLPLGLTVSSMSCEVQDTADSFPLGAASLAHPVTMAAGQTVDVTLIGNWTAGAISHFQTAHPGAKTIDVDLVNMTVDAGGINLGLKNRITVPDVPIPQE
jgi:hypothetical protein